MNIEIKNIGLIKEADILLNGLTILIGYNDTGKSTISKSIFSIVKSIVNAKKYYFKYKSDFLSDYLRVSYLELRRSLSKTKLDERLFSEIRRFIDLRELEVSSLEIFRSLIDNDYSEKVVKETKQSYDSFIRDYLVRTETRLNEFEKRYKDLFKQEGKDKIMKDLKARLKRLEEMIFSIEDFMNLYKYSFDTLIDKIFKKTINSFGQEDGSIHVREGQISLIDVKIKNNITFEFKYKDLLNFKDVCLIDSPVYLNFTNMYKSIFPNVLRTNEEDFLTDILPLYVVDILYKLQSTNYSENKLGDDFTNRISKVVQGSINFDEEQQELKFTNSKKQVIEIENLASGIKAFSIIQQLIKTGAINKDSILIMDEPEVHLHPDWLIKYSEVLIELVKKGITIILSTHSFYMLQALRKYSEINELQDKLNVYLGTRENGYSKFENKNDNLDEIYRSFSKPYQKIQDLS